jgi:hypothetical protein
MCILLLNYAHHAGRATHQSSLSPIGAAADRHLVALELLRIVTWWLWSVADIVAMTQGASARRAARSREGLGFLSLYLSGGRGTITT